MEISGLRQHVSEAFANAPRPESFTSGCECDECRALERSFQRFVRGQEISDFSGLPDGLEWQLPLLSPEGLQYLMPCLIELALQESDDGPGWEFIELLSEPISKTNPPDILPCADALTPRQIAAVVCFLTFARDNWYESAEETPKELLRAIRNWEYFEQRSQH